MFIMLRAGLDGPRIRCAQVSADGIWRHTMTRDTDRVRVLGRKALPFVAFTVLLLTAGCPNLFRPEEPANDDDFDWSSDDMAPAEEVNAAAADLYASLAREEDPRALLGILLSRFAAVAVIENDGQAIDALIDDLVTTGVPVFADFHPGVLADGFADRMMVSAESFFESLETFLAPSSSYPGHVLFSKLGFMTSDAVWSHIYNVIVHEFDGVSWVPKKEYEPQEVLPALVYALAKERAGDGASDEPWIDGYLDPLQMKLLTYAFLYAATDDPASARSSDGSGTKGARTRVAGFVGDLLGIPIGYVQALKSCATSSTLIYSHEITVNADPSIIWKHQTEQASPPAYESDPTVEVRFSFTPHTAAHRLFLETLMMASLPQNGPVPGKPVSWSLRQPLMWRTSTDVDLAEYGSLTYQENLTDGTGKARAVFTAADEIPPDQRDTVRAATGEIFATVRGLIGPGIQALERIVVALNPEAGKDSARVTVQYYEPTDGPSPGQSWLPRLAPLSLDL